MIWKINLSRNGRLRELFRNIAISTGDKIRYAAILNRLIVQLIREHIQQNQHRFNKTRKRFGVSLIHTNYVAKNVLPYSIKYPFCQVNLLIKGIERNFRPLVIIPKRSQYLTIPTARESFGKSARQFTGLFKPKGKNILARNRNGKLEVLYALTRQVYQPMQKGMLPDERILLSKAYIRLVNHITEDIYNPSVNK